MDLIKKFLLETGWNSDYLIEKVREYKENSSDLKVDNSETNTGETSKQNELAAILNCLNDTEDKSPNQSEFTPNEKVLPERQSVSHSNQTVLSEKESLLFSDDLIVCPNIQTELLNLKQQNDHDYIQIDSVEAESVGEIILTSDPIFYDDSNLVNQLESGAHCDDNEKSLEKSSFHYKLAKRTLLPRKNYVKIFKEIYKRRLQRKNVRRQSLVPNSTRKYKEVVRNQIMLQLELLRTKKCANLDEDIKLTPASESESTVSYKKRYSNDKIREEIITTPDIHETDCDSKTETNERIFSLEDVVLSNPSQFKIADVRSCCTSPDVDNMCAIRLTKTKDITKIKGWRYKNFDKPVSNDALQPTPSCSYNIPTIETDKKNLGLHVNEIHNKESNETVINTSAFASNNLDGFLHKSADLHISFKIPQLASGELSTNSVNQSQSESSLKQMHSSLSQSLVLDDDKVDLLKVQKIDNLYRPRTVAQSRRIWRLKNDSKAKRKPFDKCDEVVRKPRTLAEKRKLLDQDNMTEPPKRIKDENKVDNKVENKDKTYVIEDLKYSYVLYMGKKLRVPTKTSNEKIPYVKRGYGKKEYIYVPKRKRRTNSKTKPSIFYTTSTIAPTPLTYRPGPLCKKQELQESNAHWKAVIKRLPKVYLELYPQVNKPLHPTIRHLLPNYGSDLTEERIEFALTAVNDTSMCNQNKKFRFFVPYRNFQENILLRKKMEQNEVEPLKVDESDTNIANTVKHIMSKMLDYVETKEITDKIFKEERPSNPKDNESYYSETLQPKSNTKVKKKKSKTNYELKRLNVKVIEVNLEDKDDVTDCNQEFCKMGCVCKSLATTSSLVSNHCGITECMFKCSCRYSQTSKGNLKVTLPVGTDLLSEGAVSRLEVEAKKNLAKVEKEFTQTVIQANNHTIVVGGLSNRQRRVTKLPKKYTDFIEDPDVLPNAEINLQEEQDVLYKIDLDESKIEWKECQVNLVKLKLTPIIPYCLVHHLHDCHCNYEAKYVCTKSELKAQSVESVEQTICQSVTQNQGDLKKPVNIDLITKQDKQEGTTADTTHLHQAMRKRVINTDDQLSARVRGISTSYYAVRNRTAEYIIARRKKLSKRYRNYLENLKLDDCEPVVVDLDAVTNFSKNDTSCKEQSSEENRKNRRKQQLTTREDNTVDSLNESVYISEKNGIINVEGNTIKLPKDIEINSLKTVDYAMQRRKVKTRTYTGIKGKRSLLKNSVENYNSEQINLVIDENNKEPNTQLQKTNKAKIKKSLSQNQHSKVISKLDPVANITEPAHAVEVDILPKFVQLLQNSGNTSSDQLLAPSAAIREKFLQLLGKKNESDAQFRLLPWDCLAEQYESNKMQFWYSSYFKAPKIIVTDNNVVPKHFVNIKQFENVLNKSFIKVDLIRWLVTKTVPGGRKGDEVLVILQLTKTYCELCGICKKNTDSQSAENMVLSLIPSSVTQSKNTADAKDTELIGPSRSYRIVNKILYSRRKLLEQTLVTYDEEKDQQTIVAELPDVNNISKWRMIALESTFYILALELNDYAIKYSDLLKIINLAKDTQATIILKTSAVEENYIHKDFGIYVPPGFPDRIFVGPYFMHEDHNLSTLRYSNGTLVTTEMYSQKLGQPLIKIGTWLKQPQESGKENYHTIDLTENDSDNEINVTEVDEVNLISKISPRSVLKRKVDSTSSDVHGAEVSKSVKIKVTKPNDKTDDEVRLFTLNDIINFEMEVNDCDIVNSNVITSEEVTDIDLNKLNDEVFLITNVPMLGYILAHRLKKSVIVRWPTLNSARRFHELLDATTWLERELSELFIVPSNFTIRIKVRTSPVVEESFDSKYLKGYYIASRYGIKSLINVNAYTLKILDVTYYELKALAKKRAMKMLHDKCYEAAKVLFPVEVSKTKCCSEVVDLIMEEIILQRKIENEFKAKEISMLRRKGQLIEELAKAINGLSGYVSNKKHLEFLEILNRHGISDLKDKSFDSNSEGVSHSSVSDQTDKSSDKITEAITITIDSDDDTDIEVSDEANTQSHTQSNTIAPKITVRNIQELTDPQLNQANNSPSFVPLCAANDRRTTIRNITSVISSSAITTTVSTNSHVSKSIAKLPIAPLTVSDSKEQKLPSSGQVGAKNNAKSFTQIKLNNSPTPREKQKFLIKTPSGKLVKVNADQLKKIPNSMASTIPSGPAGNSIVTNIVKPSSTSLVSKLSSSSTSNKCVLLPISSTLMKVDLNTITQTLAGTSSQKK